MFSQASIRRAVQWLLVAAASVATLTPVIPDERARGVCLQAAGLLALFATVLLVYYGLRFGRVFLGFLIRRLCLMVVTLVGITLVTFLVVRFAPGDPVSAQAGEGGQYGPASELDIRRIRHELFGTQAVHTFRASATDPDGDRVRLEFDWGDEEPHEKSLEVASGTEVALTHPWWQAGNYAIRVRAIDEHGARSGWSPWLRVEARQGKSLPPTPPKSQGVGAPPRMEPLREPIQDNRPPLTPSRVAAGVRGDQADVDGTVRMRVETTIIEQYLRWLTNVARLDFGRSYRHSSEVWPLIIERLPKTLILSALALFLAYLIAIPIGVYSSTHRHSVVDRCLGVTVFTLYSLPSFWVATMLIVLAPSFPRIPITGLWCDDPSAHPAGADAHVPLLGLCLAGVAAALAMRLARRSRLAAGLRRALGLLVGVSLAGASLRYLPSTHLTSGILLAAILTCVVLFVFARRDRDPFTKSTAISAAATALITLLALVFVGRVLTFDLFWHAVLPVACLTYGSLAALSRYVRSGLLDAVQQDYVRTARAKGLPERTVIFKHALRNGLIPVLTLSASIFPQLISGSVIIETIFTIDGMGRLLIDSVKGRDYNVTMAVTTLIAIMTMLGLLVSDVLYVVVDPRISFDKRTSS